MDYINGNIVAVIADVLADLIDFYGLKNSIF